MVVKLSITVLFHLAIHKKLISATTFHYILLIIYIKLVLFWVFFQLHAFSRYFSQFFINIKKRVKVVQQMLKQEKADGALIYVTLFIFLLSKTLFQAFPNNLGPFPRRSRSYQSRRQRWFCKLLSLSYICQRRVCTMCIKHSKARNALSY